MDAVNHLRDTGPIWQTNITFIQEDWREILRCWVNQDCGGCLDTKQCSWCPFTSACVPNNQSIAMLAPFYNEHICPSSDERYELRTQPLGCKVSTYTSVAVVVSVASVLFDLFLLSLCIMLLRYLFRVCFRVLGRKKRAAQESTDAERDPLLPRDDAA